MRYLALILCLAACSAPQQKQMKTPAVSIAKPRVSSVPIYKDYIGHITAKTSVSVRSQVSGELVGQYFKEGQSVKAGQLLLVIDPRPYQAAVEKAKGALKESVAKLRYAKEATARYAPLVEKEFISQLNYDQYVTNMHVDEGAYEQQQAQLDTAEIDLGYCFIKAPMDCVTSKLFIKPGNYIDAAANKELMLLNQIEPILVDFVIPENDLPMIQTHQKKHPLELIVFPEPSHKTQTEGKLTLINNQVDTKTGSLLLEGTLENKEQTLWPGQFVDVRVILEKKNDAILVPNESVMAGQKGHYIYTVTEESTIEVKPVKIGIRYDDGMTLIEEGLSAGDVVVTKGQINLYPGVKVVIQ